MPWKNSESYVFILPVVPFLVFAAAYTYLAVYHGDLNLFNTVIHEGGTYTFIETTFYASHFLGHIPVHTVLALYFVGVYLCLSEKPLPAKAGWNGVILLIILLLFLVLSWMISVKWFGTEDTWSYILQQRQSVERAEQGGSWNLHLPSTMMQFLLIPVFIYAGKILFRSTIAVSKAGLTFIGSSIFFTVFITWLVNDQFFSSIGYVWTNPRYLAHSVRELATFPLIYYPVPLFFLLRYNSRDQAGWNRDSLFQGMAVIGVIFLGLFIYQAIVPLLEGIGELAQKPSFAKGGELSIVYLLSSHYIEHFLDTIYFSLFSMMLFFFSQQSAKTRYEAPAS